MFDQSHKKNCYSTTWEVQREKKKRENRCKKATFAYSRNSPHGQEECHCSESAFSGDPGLCFGDLLWQDRNPHHQSDVCQQTVHLQPDRPQPDQDLTVYSHWVHLRPGRRSVSLRSAWELDFVCGMCVCCMLHEQAPLLVLHWWKVGFLLVLVCSVISVETPHIHSHPRFVLMGLGGGLGFTCWSVIVVINVS